MKKNDSPNFDQELRLFGNVRVLATAALLSATSIILAFIAKSIFGTGPLRLTFENLPVFLSSFLFGPVIGTLTAICADLVSCLITGMAPLPLITIGAGAVGAVSGIVYRYILPNKNIKLRIAVSVITGHLIGSMIIKTIALYDWFGVSVLFRIPLYLVTSVIEALILIYLFKSKAFMNQIGKVRNKN